MNAANPNEPFPDEAALQLDANGNLRHLLTLKGLDKALLTDILDDAEGYLTPPGALPARSQSLAGTSDSGLGLDLGLHLRPLVLAGS